MDGEGSHDDSMPDPTGTLGDSSSGAGTDGGSSTDDGETDTGGSGDCGNGVVEGDEECDDGNSIDGDSCESDCTLPVCGNGIVDMYEMCLPTSGESFPFPGSPQAVALGDLDEDGLLDLLVRTRDGSVIRTLQDAQHRFTRSERVESGVWRVALHDVDADGHLDLLGLHRLSSCPNESCLSIGSWMTIRPGHGDGTFGSPASFAVGKQAEDWSLGDVNDDSLVDVVIADVGMSEILVFLNRGDERLLLPGETVQSPVPPHAIVIGDVDRDWVPDLIVASNGADAASVEVFLAIGDGGFFHELSLPAGSEVHDLAVIDLEPNGALDILTTDPVHDRIRVQVGEPDQLFPSHVDLEADGNPTHLWVGNVDGHGHGDVATAREETHSISLSIGVGAIEPWWIHTVDLEGLPGASDFGDINGDGAMDLAVPLPQQDRITVVLARP